MPTHSEAQELVSNTRIELSNEDGEWIFKLFSTVPGFEDKYIILPGQIGGFLGETEFKYESLLDTSYIYNSGNIWNSAVIWWTSTIYNDITYPAGLQIYWEGNKPVQYENPQKMMYGFKSIFGHQVRAVRPLKKR